jgi:Fe-S oxidoreductase
MTVAYFIQCLTDPLAPEQAESAVTLISACGARVVIPPAQHCCGLPFVDSGDAKGARRLARQTIEMLESTAADYVVSAANSCVAAMVHDYPHLFKDEPVWKARAERLRGRVLDLATFLDTVAQLPAGALAGPSTDVLTYHPFCQSVNVLHADQTARQLLTEVCELEVRELPEANVCCGFGGSTWFNAPEVARGIVERKLANIDSTGADLLVTDNPGCILHLRGAAHASGRPLRVRQFAEMAARLGARVSGS